MDGIEAHRQHLVDRHRQLDIAINAEMKRPSPNPTVIATLKKQKLRVKEQMMVT
jgi:hypothetical protein